MKRFPTAILLICLFTGCSSLPFKSEHYFGYSCEGTLSRFSSYCMENGQKKNINPAITALMKHSWVMVKQENWSEVIRMTSAAISIDPSYADAYALRSWAYGEKGFTENALADAQEAVRLDSENTFALNNRGSLYGRSGNFMNAKKDFQKACHGGLEAGCNNLKLLTDDCLQRAEDAFNKKNWDGAIKYTSEIEEDGIALSVRCAAYANKGQFEAAITDCDAAIKMNSNFALAYNNKGYSLELMGKKKEALLNYEFACNLNMPLGCSNLRRLNSLH